ncbi:MAG: hypothetical protein FWF08_00485 [Oscillospiraceae bacterium]|nr:hypothetical protein [Oscillospiraceae bacterium]
MKYDFSHDSIKNTKEFDYYSPDDIISIKNAEHEIENGNCVSFASAEKLMANLMQNKN